MTGKTHASCGLLVGALTTEYYNTDLFTSITVITLAIISSLLPDICHAQSKVGRRFKLISLIIRMLFGHRTFTHSILFISLVVCLLYFIQTPSHYLIAIVCGMTSHVILDMLTPRGVKLFYPVPISVKFPIVFKTGGMVDLSLASALSIGAFYLFFKSFFNDLISQLL